MAEIPLLHGHVERVWRTWRGGPYLVYWFSPYCDGWRSGPTPRYTWRLHWRQAMLMFQCGVSRDPKREDAS